MEQATLEAMEQATLEAMVSFFLMHPPIQFSLERSMRRPLWDYVRLARRMLIGGRNNSRSGHPGRWIAGRHCWCWSNHTQQQPGV
jgi:hypothetical protein